MAADSFGNILLADMRNHRIRRVDAATGIISTIAGTGTTGRSGDGGPAASARVNLSSAKDHGGIVSTGAQSFLLSASDRIRRVEAVAPAPAGRVPDGENLPGDPLTITHAPCGMINLTWGDS